jgi:hypothetical protein
MGLRGVFTGIALLYFTLDNVKLIRSTAGKEWNKEI